MRGLSSNALIVAVLQLVNVYVSHAQESARPVQIDSAKITALRSARGHRTGAIYTPSEINGTVTTLGEPDILRHISSLPGVSQGMEGSLGLFVRGANNGGNRIVLNGVPLGSSSHMLGLISSISPEVVSKTVFSPGGIDAEHGDMSSSLTEISTKRATQVPSFTSVSLSPYLLSFTRSGRTEDHMSGLLVSGRGSMLPYMAGKGLGLLQKENRLGTGIDGFMYDLTVQGDWKVGQRSRIDVMAYGSQDRYVIETAEDRFRLEWWSAALKGGWEYDISRTLALETRIYYVIASSVQHQEVLDSQKETGTSMLMSNLQNETCMASILRFRPAGAFGMDGGMEISHKAYSPANSIVTTNNLRNTVGGTTYCSTTAAGFLSFIYAMPDRLEASFGLRGAASHVLGKWRPSLDVRFKSDIYLSEHTGLELTFDKMTQFHHVLEGLPMGWSLDISIPAFSDFPEERTHQGYVGAFYGSHIGKGRLNACAGGFYRQMDNLVSYSSSANFFRITDAAWANEVVVGSGRSYGGELSVSYSSERVNTTLAYTISRTTRNFAEINDGRDFLFRYDRPHILNLNSGILLGGRTSRNGKIVTHRLNSALSYSSGNLVTIPVSSYQGELLPYWYHKGNGGIYLSSLAHRLTRTRYEYGDENNFRLKDYLRLDIAYTIEKQIGTRKSSLTFSIFNVLNRHNPMLIYNNGQEFKTVSLLPIMPSIRWNCCL